MITQRLAEALGATIMKENPESVWLVRPGDYRVFKSIAEVCKAHDVELKQLHDQHFLSTPSEFKEWAKDKKQLRLEYWYRELRKKYHILMEDDKHPLGGKWNYDQSNRKSFNKDGPQNIPKTIDWEADEITQEVITLVNDSYPDHPGELEQLAVASDSPNRHNKRLIAFWMSACKTLVITKMRCGPMNPFSITH